MKKCYFAPETHDAQLVIEHVLANATLFTGSGSESLNDGGDFDWGDGN